MREVIPTAASDSVETLLMMPSRLMHYLVSILFNLVNTTQQLNVESTVHHHDMVVKTTDSIVQKVAMATPTPQTSSTTC
jgi:hypothetical protein